MERSHQIVPSISLSRSFPSLPNFSPSTWNDEVKDIKVYVKDEGGDKVATLTIPTAEISTEDSKGRWFRLTPTKGKMDAEIKLKITIGVRKAHIPLQEYA